LTVTQIPSEKKETLKIIQAFFDFYINVTQNHHKIFLQDKKIHAEWLEIGSKIIDLKSILSHVNRTQDIGDHEKTTRDYTEAATRDYTEAVEKRSLKSKIKELLEARENVNPFSQIENEKDEIKPEIRPVLEEETRESCAYCSLFSDIGTMVCPNCGRPLNLNNARAKQ
jgi:rubrerythrin